MDGGRPFSPFIIGFFIQNENRAIGRRVLKIRRGGKRETPVDEGLRGFGADVRAAEQADVDVDATCIPKFRSHPHQRSVFSQNAGINDDRPGNVAESAIQYFPNLNIPINNRRFRLQ